MAEGQSSPDTLNARIGVLNRREVEARILKPVVEAMGEAFGHDEVRAILHQTIIKLAAAQGAELAEQMGGCAAHHFADSMEYWTRGGALEIDVLEQNDGALSFNVTRCRYAELYRSLGIGELGAILSCNRDYALIDGFNPDVSLTRTQTIMEGASHCDFRYRFPVEES
ncbi:MAG: L-2-amino-thiazoline-4-carboxylic acid hydrolase [Anaerolineales bacterium]|nr:L-2-amino-thiazoline-4-carboxylic acid hydrolase [Anaerolineales bacterium]